eukprot:TRINITY_DN6287_c0_g1_i1.p1 TRINITY_DN6287_c0_g1~~TRINITY_DN6287_c0_g1_i1.p1  ORF type:complete len:239 (+),score=39.57 TRINITY_DN6287_c0_g1_i1:144-860(+)
MACTRLFPRVLLLLCALGLGAAHTHTHVRGYSLGEAVNVECRNTSSSEWGIGPICAETGKPMSFRFGEDDFMHCGWHLPTHKEISQMAKFIEGDDAWSCRVRVAPDIEFYVPFSIGIWGVVEPSHLHLDNHINMVFHASGGRILAAASYPLKDHFHFVGVGSILPMHGPVKWFRGTSYKPLSGQDFGDTPGYPIETVLSVGVMCSLVSVVITLAASVGWYMWFQKDRLTRQMLKVKTN